MNKEYWIKWAKASLVRAIKTFCQTAISAISVSYLLSDVDWRVVFSAAALSAILSILTSLAGLPEVEVESHDCIEQE